VAAITMSSCSALALSSDSEGIVSGAARSGRATNSKIERETGGSQLVSKKKAI